MGLPRLTGVLTQWLRLCLSMQGVWVRSLVRELRSHVPLNHKRKQNRGNMATSSINPEKEEYKGWKAMATIKKKKTSS